MVQLLAIKTTLRGRELDRPQEIGDSLEVRANSEDLVNDILYAVNTNVAQASLDNIVGAERHSLTRDLAEAALVDQLTDRLQVRIAVSDEGLNKSEHLDGGSIDTNEDTIVDLTKSQELQDLADLRRDTNDTTNSDDEDKLLLSRNEDLVVSLGNSTVVNGSLLKLKTKNRDNKNSEHQTETRGIIINTA